MISELVLGFTVMIGLILFFLCFMFIWALKKENDRMFDRMLQTPSLDSFHRYTTEVHDVRKRLDVLADHLNVKIVDQSAKTVVEPKEQK
jgi:hypothetical protein